MPGNRAIAYGAEIDYALVRVDGVAPAARASAGEKLLVALALLPQLCADAGIATHHVLRLIKGADLAGVICAHPAARPRLRPRRAGAARRLRHHRRRAPASCISPPATARRISSSAARMGWRCRTPSARTAPSTPGCRCSPACMSTRRPTPVCAALTEAGGLLARGQAGALLPAFLALRAPLIFRATPQWFIRMDGRAGHPRPRAGRHRRHRFRARLGPQPARQHDRRAPGLVHQPPARLGRADRRCSSTAPPASRCATPR